MNTHTTNSQVTGHRVQVPGARLYYQTQGNGPTLVLLGGGPANADTLAPLAAQLAGRYTVVSYDRRGYSRSELDNPDEQAGIHRHGDDLRLLIGALAPEPVSVFGTSFGALIALDLAATAPGLIQAVVVHEPPLGQLLTGAQRQQFDINLEDKPDAGAALAAIAASVGVRRGLDAGGGQSLPRPAGATSSCSSAATPLPSAITSWTSAGWPPYPAAWPSPAAKPAGPSTRTGAPGG